MPAERKNAPALFACRQCEHGFADPQSLACAQEHWHDERGVVEPAGCHPLLRSSARAAVSRFTGGRSVPARGVDRRLLSPCENGARGNPDWCT